MFRIATFSSDVTPPIGHPLLANATRTPIASRIDDRLFAKGFVLLGPDKPIVVMSIDWCEIRNEAYFRWQEALAEAAGTDPERVIVSCIHQHDVPLPDLEAERILAEHGTGVSSFDLDFHERCVIGVAEAVRASLPSSRPLTRIGTGQARVEKVASNRRYLLGDGEVRYDRTSMSGGEPDKRDAGPGTVDEWLKTVSFWDGDSPICALSAFAIHPMSYWGTGWVTSDFPGLARERRQADDPSVLQIYASGASGNVTPGKYNDGRHENRAVLTERFYDAMTEAWAATRIAPITAIDFTSVPLYLEPRADPGFTPEDMTAGLEAADPRWRVLAAFGLSWRKRVASGRLLAIPAIDLGAAQIVLLPAESHVEFQLFAQAQRPDSFVVVMGYGECAPGYIPTERAWAEKDENLDDWCWTTRGAQQVMENAIATALAGDAGRSTPSEADASR